MSHTQTAHPDALPTPLPTTSPSDPREKLLESIFDDIMTLTPKSTAGSLLAIVHAAVKILTQIPVADFETLHQQVRDGVIVKVAGKTVDGELTLVKTLRRLESAYYDASRKNTIREDVVIEAGAITREALVELDMKHLVRGGDPAVRAKHRAISEERVGTIAWIEQKRDETTDLLVKQILGYIPEYINSYVSDVDGCNFWRRKAQKALDGEYEHLGAFAREVPEHLRHFSDDLLRAALYTNRGSSKPSTGRETDAEIARRRTSRRWSLV